VLWWWEWICKSKEGGGGGETLAMGREAILLGLGEDFASPGRGRSDEGTMPLCLAALVTISVTEGPFTCHTNLPSHTLPPFSFFTTPFAISSSVHTLTYIYI